MKIFRKFANIITSPASIFAFAVSYLTDAFITFTFITANSKVAHYFAYLLFGFGFLIIVGFLINIKKYKINKIVFILLLFIASFIASSVFMYQFGITENLKGLIWLSLEIIVLFWLSPKSLDDKWLITFLKTFAVITIMYSVLSIMMALTGFMYVPTGANLNNLVPGGFAHGRLHGMYSDPNYGAIASLLGILSSLYVHIKKKNMYSLIFLIISFVINIIYISLSGSRTGLVSTAISVVVLVFLMVYIKSKNKNQIKKIIISGVISILCSGFIIGVIYIIEPVYEIVELQICKNSSGTITDPKLLFPVSLADKIRAESNTADPYSDTTDQLFEKNIPQENILQETDTNTTDIDRQIDDTDVKADHIGLMGRDKSKGGVTNNRTTLWKDAILLFSKSPLIGLSNRNYILFSKDQFPDSYTSITGNSSTHNNILDVAVSQGIVGLLLWGAYTIIMIACFIFLIRTNKDKLKISILFAMFCAIWASAMLYTEIIYVNTIASVFYWYVIAHLPYDKIYFIKINKRKRGKSKN